MAGGIGAKLTDKAIKAFITKVGPGKKLADGGGLYFFITPAKGTTWRIKYRIDGKKKTYSVGPYPLVSLAAARAELREVKALLLENKDPVSERRVSWAAKSHHSSPRTSGPSEPTSKTSTRFATWPCSTWLSTASCAAAIWSICMWDVTHGIQTLPHAIITQRKTQRQVQLELTEPTRSSVSVWIESARLRGDQYLLVSSTSLSQAADIWRVTLCNKWLWTRNGEVTSRV
jgi:hypothetical protein